MFRSTTQSRVGRTLVAVVAVAGLATAAFAYWTAGGSGSGSASAAGAQDPLVANQTAVLTAMYPGDSPQTLSGDFTNPNDGPIQVNTVTASIASVTKAAGAPAGTCDATDFALTDAVMTVNAQVPAGTNVGSFSGAKIQFNNKAGANQDACKGATVALAYAVA